MNKSWHILFIALLLLSNCFAQNAAKIPELKEELRNARADSERVHALVNLCFHYSNVNMDTAMMYGTQGMELAKKTNYPRGLGDAYNNLGWCCTVRVIMRRRRIL